MVLWSLPNTEKDALEFFQEKGLLPRHRECKIGNKKKGVKTCQHKSNLRYKTSFDQSLGIKTYCRYLYSDSCTGQNRNIEIK